MQYIEQLTSKGVFKNSEYGRLVDDPTLVFTVVNPFLANPFLTNHPSIPQKKETMVNITRDVFIYSIMTKCAAIEIKQKQKVVISSC